MPTKEEPLKNAGYLAYRMHGPIIRNGHKIDHYCPVCFKKIPERAYGADNFIGCFPMYHLSADGWCMTGAGTIKLGEKPGEFDSIYPKKIFTDCYDAIRERQKTGSVRIGRCA